MAFDSSTLTLIGLLVTAVGGPIMGEWRATRLRKWVASQHETTNFKLSELDGRVESVGEDARAAYHEANGVNVWRQQLTQQLTDKQDETLTEVGHVRGITQDTNDKIERATKRPTTAPLIILAPNASEATRPAKKEGVQ